MGEKNINQAEKTELKPYVEIAEIYNHLMRSIDYKGWAKYIHNIYEDYELKGDRILELGAGTCSLSKYLFKKFPEMIVTDISHSMLSTVDFFENKKIVCDMTNLPFRSHFDFVFSTFDSVNYLIKEESVKKLFDEIFLLLSDEGIFTFDVSLEPNSIKYEKALNRKGKYDGLKFKQESIYDRETNIHTNRFLIKLRNGNFVEEVHKQKIYDIEFYFKAAEDANLLVLDCYEAFSLKEINEKSERAQFVIKRKEDHA